MVYFVMGLALFADEDYEEVWTRITETLADWGCWDREQAEVTTGGITQARQRLGPGPLELLYRNVAAPVASTLTRGAFLGGWRLMSIDGFELDVPDTAQNAAAFGYRGSGAGRSAFPKARVVTIGECGPHAKVAARLGGSSGKGGSEQALARQLYPQLEEDWLLLADRNFYSWPDWKAAAATGAALVWRVKPGLRLPALDLLADGSYRSMLINPKITREKARRQLIEAARRGDELDEDKAVPVRVIEYQVPGRGGGDGNGELITLITTIADPAEAPAQQLAQAYHQRWEEETGNDQLKTHLRGPGRVLRSKSPDMARQEIYGYLLTHYAICALICQAATEAGIDPDRLKFTRTVRVARRAIGPAFPP
jgi:hypothetical protein